MYEHPIKRAGLSFNRILFSNTKMVTPCIPTANPEKFKVTFKVKYFEGGKETHRKYITHDNTDEIFPPRPKFT